MSLKMLSIFLINSDTLADLNKTSNCRLMKCMKTEVFICKSSARTKQSVIIVALKTCLEVKLGICIYIYIMSLLHQPNDYIGFTPSCPPTLYNKMPPMLVTIHMVDIACNQTYSSYSYLSIADCLCY